MGFVAFGLLLVAVGFVWWLVGFEIEVAHGLIGFGFGFACAGMWVGRRLL